MDIDSYEYSMFWACSFSTAEYRVTVVDGRPVGLHRVDGAEVLDVPGAEVPGSVDEIFGVLEREVAAERIDATYDDELGYPLHVLVDRKLSGVDDELEIRISDFTPTE